MLKSKAQALQVLSTLLFFGIPGLLAGLLYSLIESKKSNGIGQYILDGFI